MSCCRGRDCRCGTSTGAGRIRWTPSWRLPVRRSCGRGSDGRSSQLDRGSDPVVDVFVFRLEAEALEADGEDGFGLRDVARGDGDRHPLVDTGWLTRLRVGKGPLALPPC